MEGSHCDDLVGKMVQVALFVTTSVIINKLLKKNENIIELDVPREKLQIEKATDSHRSNVKLPFEHEKRMNERLDSSTVNITENVERNRVVVRVPATSANFGPGFDTIGMAVDMWSEFTVERSDKFEIICVGEGSHDIPLDETNLVYVGLLAAFRTAKKTMPKLKLALRNRIPYARGLGSSSAAIVGGLMAGFILAGHEVPAWGSEVLLNLACEIEGHPDNVAPAIYGGIQLGIHASDRWMSERVNVPPGLQCVVFIPEDIGKTCTARAVLSDTISRKEAVFNIGRTAWLINALASNNIDQLRFGVEDALHQPQRGAAMYPHLVPVIAAAVAAGASAAYLSGAGPSVMALTSGASGDIFTQRHKERVDKKVAAAMLAAASTCGVKGEVYISAPVIHGAVVVSADPPFSQGLVRYTGDA